MDMNKKIHFDSIVADTHCDTLKCMLPVFTRPRDSMWSDRSKVGMGARSSLGHIDVPRLLEGGVTCQVFAVSGERSRTPSHSLRTALEMIDRFYGECEANRETMVPVTSHDEIVQAKRAGKVAAMLSIEGADVLEGSVDVLRVFHRLGVRMVGLVHSIRNELADGVADGRTRGGPQRAGGPGRRGAEQAGDDRGREPPE